jgi:hypothetical protein
MDKEIVKWLGVVGVAIAVLAPILAKFVSINVSWTMWAVAAIGLVAGLFVKADVKTMLAGLVLLAITGIFASIPAVGELLNGIFKNLAIFAGAFVSVSALKVLLKKVGVRF